MGKHKHIKIITKVFRSKLAVTGLLLIVTALLWAHFIIPRVANLTEDFEYSADIISVDNFYNETTNGFEPPLRSVSTFTFDVIEASEQGLLVANEFDVRTTEGEPIFSVERRLGVDPKTGAHVGGLGDRERDGYLFAPKNLDKGQPFTYWHVNYDGPARMEFEAEENLFGLPVYKYATDFDGVEIDQTDELGGLPGVGETRGIRLDPKLTIWVEPTTGRLIKYQDETTAYYYDLETGEQQNPWNRFSNTTINRSVKENAAQAKTEIANIAVVKMIVPLTLISVGLSLLVLSSSKNTALLVGFSIILTAVGYSYVLHRPLIEQPLRVGISRFVPVGNPAYDQNIDAFKEALHIAGYVEGENIEYVDVSANNDRVKQQQIVNDFVEEDFDLIYSLTTPGTLALSNVISDVPIVFSVVTYPVEAGLISSLQSSGNNLVGTRNWVPPDEQISNFLQLAPNVKKIGYVHRAGEINSAIQFAEMQQAAKDFDVEIISINAPDLRGLQTSLESQKQELNAVYSACDTLVQGQAEEFIISFALENRLPSFSCNESGVRKGDLIGSVADFEKIGQLAGQKAARVFDGFSPTLLSTETVSRPFIYINAATAAVLGVSIPQDLEASAREIIK